MTLYQFRALRKEIQTQTAWNGAFLMRREEENYTVVLYKLDGFYVEVYYNVNNQVNKLSSFHFKKTLELYFKSLLN